MDGGQSAVLEFIDGPAEGERIETLAPPTKSRWFVQSPEMGSDDTMSWWTHEEPPDDGTVEITRYDLVDENRSIVNGGILYRYEVAQPEENMSIEDLISHLREEEAEQPNPPQALFSDQDICEVLIAGNWYPISTPTNVSSVVIEPNDSEVKLGIGPCFVSKMGTLHGADWMLIPPHTVQAFRVKNSSVGSKVEGSSDGTVLRMSMSEWERISEQGGPGSQEVAHADTVVAVRENGREEIVKDKRGEDG